MPMGKREIQINSSVENARGTDISLCWLMARGHGERD